MRLYASSLGLTQVMGYHALERGEDAAKLYSGEFNLKFACRLLAEFAQRYGLELSTEFEALFRSWNTGRPDRVTHDPDYVSKGLARMEIYRSLQAEA